MKDFDKDWCVDAAKREDGQEVGVDTLGMDQPLVKLRLKLTEAQSELTQAQERIDELEDKQNEINNWCKAYPRTVFIEPTEEMWAEANRVLDAADGCPSLTAISGSNMRHVVEGIQKILETPNG